MLTHISKLSEDKLFRLSHQLRTTVHLAERPNAKAVSSVNVMSEEAATCLLQVQQLKHVGGRQNILHVVHSDFCLPGVHVSDDETHHIGFNLLQLNHTLLTLSHTDGEHGAKVGTTTGQNGFMCAIRLIPNYQGHVREFLVLQKAKENSEGFF